MSMRTFLRVTSAMGATPGARASATAAVNKVSPDNWKRAKPFSEIPGPDPLPIVGNTWRFFPWIGPLGGKTRSESHKHMRSKYGDLVRVSNLKGVDDVWVFDPVFAEAVYRHEGPWPLRDDFQALGYYRKVFRKERFDAIDGVLPSNYESWRNFRRSVNAPLLKPVMVKQYAGIISDVTNDFIMRIRNIRDENLEVHSNFINEIYKWSLESITMVGTGKRLGCLDLNLKPDSKQQIFVDDIFEALDGIFIMDNSFSPWKHIHTPVWRKFVKYMDRFTDYAENHIKEALTSLKPGDDSRLPTILERLLERAPTTVAIIMVMDMIFGGVDTTSHATAALLWHLAKNTEALEQVAREVRRALPSHTAPLTDDAIAAMPYLRACLKEAIRLFPIFPENIRLMPEDCVLAGYQIPKGAAMRICHGIMGQDESQFPEADRFLPERWEKGHPYHGSAHPFAYLPFGFGPRMCIGQRFAELEILTFASKLCHQFSIEYLHGNKLEFVEKAVNFVTSPLKFKITERPE